MERQARAFQILKPHCVALNQAALCNNPKDTVDALRKVYADLQKMAVDPPALDERLAEYVFFPLSHVLRGMGSNPLVALELTLKCLGVLLRSGWRYSLDPAMVRELLLLLPVLVSESPRSPARSFTPSEDLQEAGFASLKELFVSYSQATRCRGALLETDTILPFSHAIFTTLQGVTAGTSPDVQLAAALALEAGCMAVDDQEALSSFLPGIVSKMANVLTPLTKQRRSVEFLLSSLRTLTFLLKSVLSDRRTKDLPPSDEATDHPRQKLTQSWLKATAIKMKQALANIVRIRQHHRPEVRRALFDLCVTVLDDCHSSLQGCATLMIETLTVLCESDEDGSMAFETKQMLAASPESAELLRSSMHDWIVSLPRVMQSPDESAKSRLIRRLATGYQLLADQGVDMELVDEAVASNLRDGIAVAITDQPKLKEISPASAPDTTLALIPSAKDSPSVEFAPVVFDNSAQRDMGHHLRRLVQRIATSKSALNAVHGLVDSVQFGTGADRLASFWVALELLKCSFASEETMTKFVDLGNLTSGTREDLLEELYSLSLDVLQLGPTGSTTDWTLHALAMETIALQARTLKVDFRVELIDALYQVVHMVASPVDQLRNHAITCLNIIAASCGYSDVGRLIIENVDYLVNAVALKLNTFDISPQAPQVLLMMITLSGPSLLPYLDDIVESIFAALESFHGYPRLVELLFSVLRGIAHQGIKAPQLAISHDSTRSEAEQARPMTSVHDIISVLKDIRDRGAKEDASPDDVAEVAPRRPWKKLGGGKGSLATEIEDVEESNKQTVGEHAEDVPTTTPPPATKTYSLLLRISQLTQHYLSAASPTLRTSLLDLLRTTAPVLAAHHDDSFLPLINTLWPVLVPRLADAEAYVVAGTLHLMSDLCALARDFMRSRVEAVWPTLCDLYRSGRPSSSPAPAPSLALLEPSTYVATPEAGVGPVQRYYTTAPTRIIRGALIELFVSIVQAVHIGDAAFEEALELLLPVIAERREVKEAFEKRNTDAVWLALLRREAARDREAERSSTAERAGRQTPGAWKGRVFAPVGVEMPARA